jgi:outer membrane protein assembly factor BamB
MPGYAYNDWRWLALVGGTVVASSMSGSAVGLDPATGAVRWTTFVHGASLLGSIGTDGRLAIIAGGEVVALDGATGAIVWRTGEGRAGGKYFAEAAIDGGRVFANHTDGFVALRAR